MAKTAEQWERDFIQIHRWRDLFDGIRALSTSRPDLEVIKRAKQFLVEGPQFHGSGYLKEEVWRKIAGIKMSAKDWDELESAALKYLSRRVTREFWYMARAMSRKGSPSFWAEVRTIHKRAETVDQQLRAELLLEYEGNLSRGERNRLLFKMSH